MSSWASGYLGQFEPFDGIENRLKNFRFVKGGETRLWSVIQLQPDWCPLGNGNKLFEGLVIDEIMSRKAHLVEENGVLKISRDPKKDTRVGRFWITTNGIIIVEKGNQADFVFYAISNALYGRDTGIVPIKMDINKIAEDYKGHWLGGIHHRPGNMQSGIFFGHDIEEDNIIGKEYMRNKKNQVGIETSYFGIPRKVKITAKGIITIYLNLDGQMNRFVEFVRDELLKYALTIEGYPLKLVRI